MNMVILIIRIVLIIACIILIVEDMERQREIERKKRAREMYKECTGHYPEEAEAVAKRQAQEFADILKRQDLWKLQLILRVPDMYHFTRDKAEDFARKILRRKGLTKEDCVRIGYPSLARLADTERRTGGMTFGMDSELCSPEHQRSARRCKM